MMLRFLADHLWQSTMVLGLAAGLALVCARSSARVRYAIWTLASIKFLVPFAWLTAAGALLPWPAIVDRDPASVTTAVVFVGRPFSSGVGPAAASVSPPAPTGDRKPTVVLLVTWAVGGLLVAARRGRRAWSARSLRSSARPLRSGRVRDLFATCIPSADRRRLDLRETSERLSPCVVGIRRPVLLWPRGIDAHLDDQQIHGILAHEAAHVRRGHNRDAAVQGLVEALCWFHPGVWWLGRRLVVERELVCDEDAIAAGIDRTEYARSLVAVGTFAVSCPAPGAASMTGAALIHRMEAVMTTDVVHRLDGWRRIVLALAGAALVTGPIIVGAAGAPRSGVAVQAATGIVSGAVVDEQGVAIAGARVSLLSMEDGRVLLSTESDADGRYAMAGLAPAAYAVRVERPGFQRFTARVEIQGGATATTDARLALGTLSETIAVRILPEADAADQVASPAAADRGRRASLDGLAPGAAALFDEAEVLYRQERYTESDVALARAVALVGAHASVDRAAALLEAGESAGRPASGGQVSAPTKVRDVEPIYPAAARAVGASGTVILEARIGADGTVRDTRVVRSVPALDAAAVRAVRQWLFTPAELNGVPTEVGMMVSMAFVAPRE